MINRLTGHHEILHLVYSNYYWDLPKPTDIHLVEKSLAIMKQRERIGKSIND